MIMLAARLGSTLIKLAARLGSTLIMLAAGRGSTLIMLAARLGSTLIMLAAKLDIDNACSRARKNIGYASARLGGTLIMLAARARKHSGFLYRAFSQADCRIGSYLYKAIVLPTLEYCCATWILLLRHS